MIENIALVLMALHRATLQMHWFSIEKSLNPLAKVAAGER